VRLKKRCSFKGWEAGTQTRAEEAGSRGGLSETALCGICVFFLCMEPISRSQKEIVKEGDAKRKATQVYMFDWESIPNT